MNPAVAGLQQERVGELGPGLLCQRGDAPPGPSLVLGHCQAQVLAAGSRVIEGQQNAPIGQAQCRKAGVRVGKVK